MGIVKDIRLDIEFLDIILDYLDREIVRGDQVDMIEYMSTCSRIIVEESTDGEVRVEFIDEGRSLVWFLYGNDIEFKWRYS